MVEAVRTTQSTFGIWVIVAVAMISLAVWLVGVYIADGYQARLSRLHRRMRAPGPALDDGGATAATIPGQRRYAGQPAPEQEPEAVTTPRGRHHRPDQETAGSSAAGRPSDLIQSDFRRDGPLTQVEHELQRNAPARANVPAQSRSGQPASDQSASGQPASGRHAMPAQRSGDSDRAERSYAGPDEPDVEDGC